MTDSTISDLPALAAADANDLLVIIDVNPTPIDKNITVANLIGAPIAAHGAASDPHPGYAREGLATLGDLTVSAEDRLLGRVTAGAGAIEEVILTAAARTILDDSTVAAILATIGGLSLAPAASQAVVSGGAAVVPLQVKAHASQSANISEILNSAGVALGYWDSAGALNIDVAGTAQRWSRYAADAGPPTVIARKSRHATPGSHTIVQSGDGALAIIAQASDGAAFRVVGRIDVVVDGTPGASDMPGRIAFSTTPDGSATPVERLRIDNAGRIILGAGGTGPQLLQGTGTPEGVVTAPVGSIFLRTDGGASTTLYVKQTGAGNTGWGAK